MLEDESAEIRSEIEELRNRKDRIKQRAREAFDEAMDEILSRFGTGFETAVSPPTSISSSLVTVEKPVSMHSSEGELELIGFVAALAGYESFDVDEAVPLCSSTVSAG